ncbi:MAG: riboflavin synthase [Novosphingobium sp.]
MFTGTVSAIGQIRSIRDAGDLRAVVSCPYDPDEIMIGASIACSGVCLTIVERGGEPGDAWFAADISAETISRTAQDQWTSGRKLNLEQALKLGDQLGGHIVTGHADAVGRVTLREELGGSIHLTVTTSAEVASLIAIKGSIAVDGVSLTVNALDDYPDGTCSFHLNIIPYTAGVTTLGELREGDAVNLEIDVLARYLQRMVKLRS